MNKPGEMNTDLDIGDIDRMLYSVRHSIERNIPRIGSKTPAIGRTDYSWEYCGPSNWVSGFWAGQLWLCYAAFGDRAFLDAARDQLPYHERLLADTSSHDHDLGFQYSLTAVADYKNTNDPHARKLALKAAGYLSNRFREQGRYLVAWNDDHEIGPDRVRGKTIIDSLQNLPLLFWAEEMTGDPRFKKIAMAHADTLLAHIVRDDFSSFHTFDFDPDTGSPIGGETVQGYSDTSCWARGQAWAIHGFAQIYRYTDDKKYLSAAKHMADYAMLHMPSDNVPLWDYDLPAHAPQHKDSSAGAITAAGSFLIASLTSNRYEQETYYNFGIRLLLGLNMTCDISNNQSAMGLLRRGASHVKIGLEDHMLPYGDYYYLEALLRAKGHQLFFW